MKKPYVKPELFYESFVLNQSIAACGIDVNQADTNDCQPTLDDDFWGIRETVFTGEESRCKIDIQTTEAYCYTSGTSEAGRLFNS